MCGFWAVCENFIIIKALRHHMFCADALRRGRGRGCVLRVEVRMTPPTDPTSAPTMAAATCGRGPTRGWL